MIIKNNFNRIDKIVDTVNNNNFGVLFHSTKEIEDFQYAAGMEGHYSKEYQHHYWNAVGRLEAEGQILDIAIPLVMVHYHQEVSGSSIEVNLGEVGVASNAASELVAKKFKELQETEFYKKIVESGIIHWKLTPMNSIHAHPSGVNRFSGTDLRQNIDHPGVCYPLSLGEKIPNFASIIQHKEELAQIIHTEYRVFTGVKDGMRLYEKGRCLTIVRGFENEPLPPPEFEGNGVIDTLFGTTRPVQKSIKSEKNRTSYLLKDELHGNQGEEFAREFKNLWDESEFMIDTSLIEEKNVIIGPGRLLNAKKYGKKENPNQNTFGLYATKKNKKKSKSKPLSQVEREMINALTEVGYDLQEVMDLTRVELESLFDIEVEQVVNESRALNESKALNITEDNEDEDFRPQPELLESSKMGEYLIKDGIIGLEKIMMMSSDAVRILYTDCYGS